MKLENVRNFKAHQMQMARKISSRCGGCKYNVGYRNLTPFVYYCDETHKLQALDASLIPFPAPVVRSSKSRLIVIMRFEHPMLSKSLLGKILKRQFEVETVGNGFEVRTSYALNTIARLYSSPTSKTAGYTGTSDSVEIGNYAKNLHYDFQRKKEVLKKLGRV